MKKLLILILMAVVSQELLGQDENRFRNFHGIKHPQSLVDFYEAEGYEIFVQPFSNGLDEKGVSKIRKKYSATDAHISTDSLLNIKVLTREEKSNGVTAYFTYYLVPESAKKSKVIGLIRLKSRDIELEREFVNSYLKDQIPSFVYTKMEIDSIDFVGRTITLGPICRWMKPHNIQCPNYGQMNWAIFNDLKQAEDYRDTHFEMAKNRSLTEVKEEQWVPLKFEGNETKALRTKVKIQLPKMMMGGSNILVVYYVTGQVRGKYVTCVLSHYTNDVGADKLPPLLSEVLELME